MFDRTYPECDGPDPACNQDQQPDTPHDHTSPPFDVHKKTQSTACKWKSRGWAFNAPDQSPQLTNSALLVSSAHEICIGRTRGQQAQCILSFSTEHVNVLKTPRAWGFVSVDLGDDCGWGIGPGGGRKRARRWRTADKTFRVHRVRSLQDGSPRSRHAMRRRLADTYSRRRFPAPHFYDALFEVRGRVCSG